MKENEMIFGGLVKNSLIDFPGRISAVLFLCGCNFRCPYCHNPSLVEGPFAAALASEDLRCFLESRQGLLDGVVISGGEPTLHEGLAGLARSIKEMGFLVKLDTNGSAPGVIEHLIAGECVDYIAMDIKTAPRLYPAFISQEADPEAIRRSVDVIRSSGVAYEFRTTCVKQMITPKTMEAILETISGADRYLLQRCQPQVMLNPAFFQRRSPSFSAAEMAALKAMAERHVKTCHIR